MTFGCLKINFLLVKRILYDLIFPILKIVELLTQGYIQIIDNCFVCLNKLSKRTRKMLCWFAVKVLKLSIEIFIAENFLNVMGYSITR